MSRRRLRTVLTAAAACTAALAAVASPAAAATGDRARWLLDEAGSPLTASDSSGNGNVGANSDIVGTGTGYVFNGISSRVIVPTSDSLNPGTANFSFGATLVMDAPPLTGQTYDVLRKGITTTPGGDYKLEIVNVAGSARARCVVKDALRVAPLVQGTTNLADGKQHTITCSRVGNSLVLQVDSLAPRTKTVPALGSVSNSLDVGLGAKAEATPRTGFDWYLGTMLEAWVSSP